MALNDFETDGEIGYQEETRYALPSMYKVILLNDDYTTMDFVVEILQLVFHKDRKEAVEIMETVHKKGKGVVGIYTYDVALSRIRLTTRLAQQRGFPLKCDLEKVDG